MSAQAGAHPAAKAIILMYHRVAEPELDPWELCVSPTHFDQQLEVLCDERAVTTLTVLAAEGVSSTETSVALTLDDGYADTLTAALPALGRRGLPLTAYVMTAGFDGDTACWWDVLAELLLRPGDLPMTPPPETTAVAVQPLLDGARRYTVDDADRHRSWRASTPPPTPRHELYLRVWAHLIELGPADLDRSLDQLREWLGVDPVPDARLLTADEVGALAADPNVTIGGHTVHHPALPSLPRGDQRREILDGVRRLEAVTGTPVTHFAYPYGRYDWSVACLARDLGLETAATTDPAPVTPASDPLMLPRYLVPDLDGERFSAWLARLR